ncbi:MAG: Transposase, partial [uncultured Rubrobacteraceae bacterium]
GWRSPRTGRERGGRDHLPGRPRVRFATLALRRDGEDPPAARHNGGGDERGEAAGVVRRGAEGPNPPFGLREVGVGGLL